MKNREAYAKDPAKNRPLNNGVATVNDAFSEDERRTLRFELETFVCDGQYEKGLERILATFLKNQAQPNQPGVWVSGFFGSGKSHLIKVLRALWTDFTFQEDKATARGLVKMPPSIKDHLVELDRAAKKFGGLHACSGTLGAGISDNVRMALLGIVFKSVGLSEQYPFARFELWLKDNGYFAAVKSAVEAAGKDWHSELRALYVSPVISKALLEVYPDFAPSAADARKLLKETYPNVQDVTIDQMVDAIRDALSVDGKMPLTLIALDEVQQYIGSNQDRAYAIQEVTEACCNRLGSRLMFVGTGQTALSGTPLLQKLMGRFPIPVELSDNDVDEVIRQVILAKKSTAVAPITKVLENNLGEISRQLENTKIGYSPDDSDYLVPDYPILPVRRRFWERTLRAVDQAGTVGQLRSQLGIVHEAALATADVEIGNVVAGDFIYDQIAPKLLQTGVLPKEIFEYEQKLREGTAKSKLKARICSLVFLIGKLPQDAGADVGVRATVDSLSDLLVTDLEKGSSELRKEIPSLLKELEQDGKVMQIGTEWRTQTKESGAWNDEYRTQLNKILSNPQRIEQERVDLLRHECGERLGKLKVPHGKSNEQRKPTLITSAEPPKDLHKALYIWVRDGWVEDRKSVEADAKSAGNKSPAVFVYLPRHAPDELRETLARWRAAAATLTIKGTPNTAEGVEARHAMESRAGEAERRVRALLNEVFSSAVVLQAGGAEVVESSVEQGVRSAVENALVRLFPRFDEADDSRWDKVIERARKGSEAALEAVGYKGEVEKHPVTQAVLKFVVAGKTGSEVRALFSEPEYGWTKDAIDGALYALLASGHLRATDVSGKALDAKSLDRAKIAQVHFRAETIPITAAERIQIRKLYQDVGVPCSSGEELSSTSRFLARMHELAASAGGDAPRPEKPSVLTLAELEKLAGNEQLSALYNQRRALLDQSKEWLATGQKIQARLPGWTHLQALIEHSSELPEVASVQAESETIHASRLLLSDPDPVPSLVEQVTQVLRSALIDARKLYSDQHAAGMAKLNSDANWAQLSPEQRHELLQEHGLTKVPDVATGTTQEVLASVRTTSLATWADRTAALGTRFQQVQLEAAALLEPKATYYELPSATLKTQAEVRAWVQELERDLVARLEKADGPLVVH